MNYKEYFKSLKIPLKETSKVFKSLFESIAFSFESLREFSKTILKSHFIQSKSSESRSDDHLFAEERGMEKIKGEDKDSYHNRVLNAYSFLKNSPTKQGIENIIASFTTKELRSEKFTR